MTLKLYGSSISIYSRTIALVCKQAGVPYERIDVDTALTKTPEYFAKHPFGQVPYVDDDGLILFESRAICRYIAMKSGKLIPPESDLRARALFEVAASIEMTNFDPHAMAIVVQRVAVPMRGGVPDEAKVTEAAEMLGKRLEGYERMLGKQRYLAGDELTVADLFHLPLGSWLAEQKMGFLENEEKYPNVARWWKEISELESWKAVKEGA